VELRDVPVFVAKVGKHESQPTSLNPARLLGAHISSVAPARRGEADEMWESTNLNPQALYHGAAISRAEGSPTEELSSRATPASPATRSEQLTDYIHAGDYTIIAKRLYPQIAIAKVNGQLTSSLERTPI
jgi:hypothetical protein